MDCMRIAGVRSRPDEARLPSDRTEKPAIWNMNEKKVFSY